MTSQGPHHLIQCVDSPDSLLLQGCQLLASDAELAGGIVHTQVAVMVPGETMHEQHMVRATDAPSRMS